MGKYTLNIDLSTYIAMFYTHCYVLGASNRFECVQILRLYITSEYKNP